MSNKVFFNLITEIIIGKKKGLYLCFSAWRPPQPKDCPTIEIIIGKKRGLYLCFSAWRPPQPKDNPTILAKLLLRGFEWTGTETKI
jgi:hypothetical protein